MFSKCNLSYIIQLIFYLISVLGEILIYFARYTIYGKIQRIGMNNFFFVDLLFIIVYYAYCI